MRILVTIAHYCGPPSAGRKLLYGSQAAQLPRAAALGTQLTTLHRNFGHRRFAGAMPELAPALADGRRLDIVIATVTGRNVLAEAGIGWNSFEVVYYDGDPMLLGFECQRIARERLGHYDVYAMLEDDLILHDPDFFEKSVWFVHEFGPTRVLQPHRVEVSKSGPVLGKVFVDPPVLGPSKPQLQGLGSARLEAEYAGRHQGFDRASNPHSGCWIVTDEQLRYWVKQPEFYDRDSSWIGSLESAATRALALSFDVFKPAAPDPSFLELEHYCLHYANHGWKPDGALFGLDPLLLLAQRAGAGSTADSVAAQQQTGEMSAENSRMSRILKSRRKTFGHLLGTFLRKPLG